MNPTDITKGQTLTFTRRDGGQVTVKALGEAYFGPFGWAVTVTVIDGPWQGKNLEVQASDLTATS